MPIASKQERGLPKSVILCDHCGQEITDANEGGCQWLPGTDAGVSVPVLFLHKSCRQAFEQAKPGTWVSLDLESLPTFLAGSLKSFRFVELEIERKAVELPIELGKLGLKGTLIGAISGVVLLVILACLGAFIEKASITGWHLCIITGCVCATVAFYGAFVFDRSFRLAGEWQGGAFQAGVGDPLARRRPTKDGQTGSANTPPLRQTP